MGYPNGEFLMGELVKVAVSEEQKYNQYEPVFKYLCRASDSIMKNIDSDEVKVSEQMLTAQTKVDCSDDNEQDPSEVNTVNPKKESKAK